MNVIYLKYAVAVAKAGSLNKAAEELFVAQPNLSRAIKELEKELGTVIFERTSKGISLGKNQDFCGKRTPLGLYFGGFFEISRRFRRRTLQSNRKRNRQPYRYRRRYQQGLYDRRSPLSVAGGQAGERSL